MEADVRALTKKVDDLTRGVNRMANVLEALNKNFVEFHKMVKFELEGDDVSGVGGDSLEPRHETIL
jgi:hypothetical protein